MERGQFLCSSWNIVDLITVLLGCLQLALAGTVNLSLLRLSRIARVLTLAILKHALCALNLGAPNFTVSFVSLVVAFKHEPGSKQMFSIVE